MFTKRHGSFTDAVTKACFRLLYADRDLICTYQLMDTRNSDGRSETAKICNTLVFGVSSVGNGYWLKSNGNCIHHGIVKYANPLV